jgi:hypothetical protein
MFLGGSYHDRDNPHMWGVSHGQLIVFITIVCNQKEGRQQSSSRRGLRTSVAEDDEMMMMMTNFYRGTGTKCTAEQNLVTRNVDDVDDDNTDNNSSSHSPSTNPNTNNNNKTPQTKKARPHQEVPTPVVARLTTMTRTPMIPTAEDQHEAPGDDEDEDDNPPLFNDKEGDEGTRTRWQQRTTMGMTMTGATDDDDGRWSRRNSRRRHNQEARMMMMGMTETTPPATGTLDRKTSQASPAACLYNNNQHKKTREA